MVQSYEKKEKTMPATPKKRRALPLSAFRVTSGIRTHDIQNHNLTL